VTDTTVLEASSRAKAGKGAARATRRAGLVPAVIYGAHKAPTLVALDPRLVVREMQRGGWRSRIYEVRAGGTTERALLREIQLHPVSDKPLHVDFHRVAAGETVRVTVRIEFAGAENSVGVKKGGVLNIVHHSVDVLVDPDRIPEHVVADIATLDVGDVVRWGDLRGTEALRLAHEDADLVVATIAAPTVETEATDETAPDATPATEGGTEA
jgi:large subunit ribosomal protein L25